MDEFEHHTEAGAALTGLILECLRFTARAGASHEAIAAAAGLSNARWSVLDAARGGSPGRTVPQIARALGLKRQGIQKIVRQLVAEQFVVLRENPDHAKAHFVCVTLAGQRMIERLSREQARWANRVAADLSVARLRQAAHELARVRAVVAPPVARSGKGRRVA